MCERKRGLCRIVAMGAWRGEDTRGQLVEFLNRFGARLSVVRVDAIGVGHNSALHLRDHHLRVDMVTSPCPARANHTGA